MMVSPEKVFPASIQTKISIGSLLQLQVVREEYLSIVSTLWESKAFHCTVSRHGLFAEIFLPAIQAAISKLPAKTANFSLCDCIILNC